jgi:6-phosphogluconolactonase (cycloisomerase 2 family)
MRIRLTWIVAILALVAIGFLMACSTKYSASSNGLVIVPSQNLAVMSSFSINLSNGEVSQIYDDNGPTTAGLPTSVVADPAGEFAFVIVLQNPAVIGSVTGLEAYQIASDGKLANIATVPFNPESIYLSGTSSPPEMVPVAPVALAIDSSGQFLFVADSSTIDGSGNQIPGAISMFSISSGGTPTEVAGSPFVLPVNGVSSTQTGPCTAAFLCSSASALAVTPTVYPVLYSYCSETNPPTTEYLYVTDAANYIVLNYSVDQSAGTISLTLPQSGGVGVPTGTVPSGVAIDPCNRFVYVSNQTPDNTVSAYTICNSVNTACPAADYRLLPVTGKLFPTGDNPGPLAVDAYGKFLYVVDTGSNQLSGFEINPSTGSLTAFTTEPSTGSGPNAIAIRSDDSWLFVSNVNSNTLSQYSIVPATGGLTPAAEPITTFNYPSGVAVK